MTRRSPGGRAWSARPPGAGARGTSGKVPEAESGRLGQSAGQAGTVASRLQQAEFAERGDGAAAAARRSPRSSSPAPSRDPRPGPPGARRRPSPRTRRDLGQRQPARVRRSTPAITLDTRETVEARGARRGCGEPARVRDQRTAPRTSTSAGGPPGVICGCAGAGDRARSSWERKRLGSGRAGLDILLLAHLEAADLVRRPVAGSSAARTAQAQRRVPVRLRTAAPRPPGARASAGQRCCPSLVTWPTRMVARSRPRHPASARRDTCAPG